MSRRVVSRHVLSCHVMSCQTCHVMSCHVTSRCVASRHVASRHIMSCPVLSRHLFSCYASRLSCHVLSRRVISRHVTRHVISWRRLAGLRSPRTLRGVKAEPAKTRRNKNRGRVANRSAGAKGHAQLLCVPLPYRLYIPETSATGSPRYYLVYFIDGCV